MIFLVERCYKCASFTRSFFRFSSLWLLLTVTVWHGNKDASYGLL
jgi:hypothetical protein